MANKSVSRTISFITAFICLISWSLPAGAISIKEEKELSQEFMRVVYRHFEMVDDPVIVDYVTEIGKTILAGMPRQPFDYHFMVIKEDVYNAFAIPAGYIFVNSGLFLAMDREDEMAGILAHEISHVVCRHISQRIDRSKKIDLASMAGMVAGIFLGIAGAGAAAQALTFGSAAAGQSLSLAYSREDESQADQFGLKYLDKAGYSPQGLLDILKEIRSQQWFGSNQIPTYLMTHPAVEDRITQIDAYMSSQNHPTVEQNTVERARRFRRIQYRLRALYADADGTRLFFKNGLAKNPSDTELAYGYGLFLARIGNRAEALQYLQQALAKNAFDPVILGDLGKVYFLDGRIEEAQRVLQGATSLSGASPEALFYLGRTRMELGNFAAAADAFEKLLQRNDEYIPVYYALGDTYGKLNRMPEAHYYLGLFHFKKGDDRAAYYHLKRAQKEIQDPDKLAVIKSTLEIIGKFPEETQQQ